jgi:hypothetical protein
LKILLVENMAESRRRRPVIKTITSEAGYLLFCFIGIGKLFLRTFFDAKGILVRILECGELAILGKFRHPPHAVAQIQVRYVTGVPLTETWFRF